MQLEELKNATIDERTEVDHNILQEQEYKITNVSAKLTQLSQKVDQVRLSYGILIIAYLEQFNFLLSGNFIGFFYKTI